MLRAVASARVKKIDAYADLARDLGITADDFRDFAAGRNDLTEPQLKAMAKEFFDAEFDATCNRLRSKHAKAPTTFASAIPGPLQLDWLDVTKLPFFKPAPLQSPGPGLTKPWDGSRPGWA